MDSQTPYQRGYKMPAEWGRHEAVWLAWPYDETTFPHRVERAQTVFCDMVKALEGSERVELIVRDAAMQEFASRRLASIGSDLSNVTFHTVEFCDVWTRDYGPVYVTRKDSPRAWTKWIYNAYGKGDDPYYAPVLVDNDVFNTLAIQGVKYEPEIVFEGGAVDVNGAGVGLTCEQTLLNPNRNPHLSRSDMEAYLHDYLGIEKTIWLKEGLVNDHTDGHIDEIARFVSPDTIVCPIEEDQNDKNYGILKDNFERLIQATDLSGGPFKIITLPMPHMTYDDGSKAPVSYCNFYISNTVVLAAVFNDPNDGKALAILRDCFPGRTIVPIDCRDIIYGGGAVHCMTQQIPS